MNELFALITLKFTVNFRVMYTRMLKTQNHSFFLFGPRSVGKSTWIRARYPKARIIDLLQASIAMKYANVFHGNSVVYSTTIH